MLNNGLFMILVFGFGIWTGHILTMFFIKRFTKQLIFAITNKTSKVYLVVQDKNNND